ncbi:MAG: hypothetical protein PVJ42_11155 [bacterium]|jgi:hypothetical protein
MKVVIAPAVVLALLVAMPVLAGTPLDGTYKSLDGDMANGRFSESWYGGGQGQIGNTVHSMSYDVTGAVNEWRIWCPSLAEAPVLIADNRDANGTGQVEYQSTYQGGYFWLTGTGPWGTGDAEYTGYFTIYIHNTTFIFFNNIPISYTTNAQMEGFFDGYCKCILVVANGASVGNGAQPSDYPAFLESDCDEDTGLTGEWGTVADITMTIYQCASAAEQSTWGTIKSLYR